MLTKDDMEAFTGYSDWVEGKMMTEGHTRLMENTLGLMGEAGEVAEKIKKTLRDGNTIEPDDIMKELGDVAFYLTGLANFFGGSLASTLVMNMEKLDSRARRGKLKGNGDNR